MSNSVPEGWYQSKLGVVADLIMGQSPPSNTYNNSRIGLPFFQGKTDFGSHYPSVRVWCSKPTKVAEKDSILFSVRAPVGDINIASESCCIGRGLAAIKGTKVEQAFLYQTFKFVKHRFQLLAQGSTFEAVSGGEMRDFKLILPPLPEQKKIAAILTSVDTVIEKTQAQIDKLKDLKTGMMQELLTKGIGHTEFKDSPVGRIPVEWEVVTLADLISSMDGGVSVNSENKQKASGEMGILKTSCVSKGNFYPNENKVVLHNEMDRLKTPVKDDHIIFSRMNTPALVGESGYVNKSYDDLFLPDRLWLIDVYRDKVYVLWLSYILAFNSTRKKITDAATGTSGSMKNISKPSLLSIKIAYPHINEQEKIASILKSVDKKLNKTLHKLSSYQNIKKVLMQDLLTGKVRVKL